MSETIEKLTQERDYFKAAYARKLDEHSATLADAIQLCKERYEARAKLAATEAHCATLRAALESSLIYVESFPSSNAHDLAAIKAALAATPAECAERLKREAIRKWCAAIGEEAMMSWLDNTPEPLEPRDLLKRLLFAAGRDRAVQELRQKTEEFDARAFHVGGPAEKAFMECRDACSSRADEIAKEGKK